VGETLAALETWRLSQVQIQEDENKDERDKKEGEKKKEKEDTIMNISVLVDSPELSLVENYRMQESKAFVMNLGSTKVKMISSSAGKQTINLTLTDFGVKKTSVHCSKGSIKAPMNVLEPFGVSLNMSSSNGQSKIGIDMAAIETVVTYKVKKDDPPFFSLLSKSSFLGSFIRNQNLFFLDSISSSTTKSKRIRKKEWNNRD